MYIFTFCIKFGIESKNFSVSLYLVFRKYRRSYSFVQVIISSYMDIFKSLKCYGK